MQNKRISKTKAAGPPIPKCTLITENEAKEREIKYLARLADVTASAEFMNSAKRDFNDLEAARATREHWDHYLRCDGLPRPFSPVEVRTFIAKMRHYDEIESNGSLDWTLTVDNRSILNQNIFRVDKTRPVMELNKDNPGKYYDVNVQMCLDTLKQMDVMLDNPAEVQRMSQKQQFDIIDVYNEVDTEINKLLDRLSYRVMKMQGAYMHTEDGIMAYWSYNCKPWQMDLWGLLNVPIRFEHLEMPAMLAEMKASGVEVQIPKSVLGDCLTLRSVHTEFDNISQHAKSFEPALTQSINYPYAGIIDLPTSLENEWAMQQAIQFEMLALMENRRKEYENMLELIAEKTEQAAKIAKQNNGEAPNIVIPKAPKEPIIVPEGMVPDIYSDFIRMEDSQYAEFLDEVYHPRHLYMREFEVNLRECIMLGGIYSVFVIRRPDQTQFEKFNVILHEDGRVLYTMPDLRAEVSGHNSIPRRTSEGSRESRIRLQSNEQPFFFVSLQLPADLCRWSQPEVCQYLTEEEPVDNDSSDSIEVKRVPSIYSSIFEKRSQSMLDVGAGSVMSGNIYYPTMRTLVRQSRFAGVAINEIPLENFILKKPLKQVEIRNLERHCLPRIVSSFKLPHDVLDELREVDVPKTGLSRLVKRQEADETQAQQKVSLDFTFEDQANTPERLFPYFPVVDPMLYSDLEDDEPGALFEPTALGLLKKLDNIKAQYLNKPKQLMSQTEHVEKKFGRGPKAIARAPEKDVVEDYIPEKSPLSKNLSSKTLPSKRQSMKSSMSAKSVESIHMDNSQMQDVTHWTTKYIIDSKLDQSNHILTFKTDRLGIFGLAFKRYEHFPFRDWSMQPSEENPDEIILTVDTFHVRIFFFITNQGVRAYVTDLSKAYCANPVKYLEITEPISDFAQLRKLFISKNINIFAENDACYYIHNGYFSMKHVAAEQHTYNTMALYCKLMKFSRSSWNRLSTRRDIIMNMKMAKDTSELSEVTLRITPDQTTFVQVSENCSDQVDVIVLSYTGTWRNIGHFTDLHQAINSMVLNATELRIRDPLLLSYITRLLTELRPLSFS